jgi:competence protein ComEC
MKIAHKIIPLVLIALGIFLLVLSFAARPAVGNLRVAFLDVGQGDAIFIQTPSGKQVLVDGGPSQDVVYQLAEVMPWWDRSIDMIIATHPDKDHIGGLSEVLSRYEVSYYLDNGVNSDTETYQSLKHTIDAFTGEYITARRGMVIDLGDGVQIRVLAPEIVFEGGDDNNASVVIQLLYGESEVMLTGDTGIGVEQALAQNYSQHLPSDILKLGHHGSKTSSSQTWLDAIDPEWVVVSAGVGNSYGHPHPEVMGRINEDVKILDTRTDGLIMLESDGQTVWLNEKF